MKPGKSLISASLASLPMIFFCLLSKQELGEEGGQRISSRAIFISCGLFKNVIMIYVHCNYGLYKLFLASFNLCCLALLNCCSAERVGFQDSHCWLMKANKNHISCSNTVKHQWMIPAVKLFFKKKFICWHEWWSLLFLPIFSSFHLQSCSTDSPASSEPWPIAHSSTCNGSI